MVFFLWVDDLNESQKPDSFESVGTKKPLSWRMRLEVAIGAAKGLDYLHVIATPPVIHR
jgi:hypothetical protein